MCLQPISPRPNDGNAEPFIFCVSVNVSPGDRFDSCSNEASLKPAKKKTAWGKLPGWKECLA